MNTISRLWKIKDKINHADIIIGIGIGVTEQGTASKLSEAVARKAAELFKKGFAPKILLVGGFTQNNITEAGAMEKIILKEGIPQNNTILEATSTNTVENAKQAARILKEKHLENILIVAQEVHARRVVATFKKYLPKNITILWASAASSYDQVSHQKRLSSETRFLLWEIFWHTYHKLFTLK